MISSRERPSQPHQQAGGAGQPCAQFGDVRPVDEGAAGGAAAGTDQILRCQPLESLADGGPGNLESPRQLLFGGKAVVDPEGSVGDGGTDLVGDLARQVLLTDGIEFHGGLRWGRKQRGP